MHTLYNLITPLLDVENQTNITTNNIQIRYQIIIHHKTINNHINHILKTENHHPNHIPQINVIIPLTSKPQQYKILSPSGIQLCKYH